MKSVSIENFDEIIQEEIVLIYCWHETCAPCKTVGPLIERLETDYSSIEFVKLNTKEHRNLQEKLRVIGVPQLLVFSNGGFKGRIMYHDEKNLRLSIEKVIENRGEIGLFGLPEQMRPPSTE